MKKSILGILLLSLATLSFADNYWNGKTFTYESLTRVEDSELHFGVITFTSDRTLVIQIGKDKSETTEYNYTWDKLLSIMVIGGTGFSFTKSDNGWYMVKLESNAAPEKFFLKEVKNGNH
jgi:hypothetical protein